MPRLKKKSTPAEPVADPRFKEQKLEITGVCLIGLSLLSMVAIFLNSAGFIGEIIQGALYFLFGQRGALIPVVFIGISGGLLLGWRKITFLKRRLVSLIILVMCTLMIIHIFSGVSLDKDGWDTAIGGSGIIGHFLVTNLITWFGNIGMAIFLGICIIVAFILALEKPLVEFIRDHLKKIKKDKAIPTPVINDSESEVEVPSKNFSKTTPDAGGSLNTKVNMPLENKEVTQSSVIATLQSMLKEKDKPESKPLKNNKATGVESEPKTKYTRPDFIPPTPLKLGPYKLPDIDLIEQSKPRTKKNVNIPDQAHQLEETLAQFGVQVKVIEVHHGPVVTRYDLQPAPGVKVSKIVNLTDDLSLALAAKGLRLEAPIPGKAAIGVEVPNKETQVVTFRDMLESKPFWNSGKLSVALGTDIAGEVVVADLGKMPHILVAGATGSGKSVCVNTFIMSILYKAFPDEVKFIMIDPKMVELSMYNGIPHLMAPVVTEAKKASGALKLVVDEMERRYKLFAEARVRDLEKYNAQLQDEDPLPFIVVIIDELADLMMVAPVEVEDSICRLAQMARATGIHLVVATQRPSVDVITGLIKANVPSRIAFAVSSQIDSRTILDCMGAERLLGRGDMLFSPVGSMKPRRVQGALVTEKEIEAVIKHWKDQGEPNYQEKFLNIPEKSERIIDEEDDDLFWDAVKIVVDHGQASASILQRRLRVGYARAARLVDMMETKGLIGPYEGSKPREVYITARQMEEIKSRSEA